MNLSIHGYLPTSPAFWIILTALALADSVNPCMISLMIIMLANLAALGLERKDLTKRAVLFTVTCFLTYLFLGILIFLGYSYLYALSIAMSGFKILKGLIIALLVVSGIINLIDAIKGSKKPVFSVPDEAKKEIDRLLKYASLAATILLAVFVTVVELPCTGIFYLGLIAYIHSFAKSIIHALPILIYYNFVFVLPEILITAAIWKGEAAAELYRKYKAGRKWLRAIEGLVLLAMALVVYYFVRVG